MAPTKTAERTTRQASPQQTPTGNLPAQQQPKAPPPIVQFRDYVNQRMATLEEALPPHIRPDYFVSAIMIALQKKPSLLKCTFPSIWNACVEAAKDGLLPDNKEGAIVPYGENAEGKRVAELATWMPMIEGYRKKIFETGKVKAWEVQVVREKDDFEYELGDNAFIRHKPYVGTQNPGGIVGAYSIAKLMTGETVREVMGAFDIMQIASKSKASNGPWKDQAFVPEMARKVVARRHYKQLPHSRELSEMIARDDQRFGVDFQEGDEQIAKPQAARRLSSRQAFDAYAGATVDNETGEVLDDGPEETGEQGQSQETVQAATAPRKDATSTAAGGASRGAEASPPQRQASAPTTTTARKDGGGEQAAGPAARQETAAAPANGTEVARTEAGPGATTPAPASPSPEETAAEADADIDEMPDEPAADPQDAADRPWPPGAEPTTIDEYERYLRTKLAAMTKANEVAPWFNSDAEKALRAACQTAPRFQEFQQLAITRRKELP
ncbi:recombinase RecT [Bradyrhizobium japonicum]|uniref:recombinase RecT n=1 Tax=Bradyrhizobium japonicum TaxID=375 RepID=UPI0004170439|nr:recombinase RecT [Bradyrhizobium japonicum]